MKKIRILAAVFTVLLLAGLCACQKETEADLWADALYTEDTELGEGAETVTVSVEAEDKAVIFTVHTDGETLGEALLDAGVIAGEQGDYGLYIQSVNGIVADYDVDQSYWAFYIGEEYAMTGVDGAELDETAEYRLVYEK